MEFADVINSFASDDPIGLIKKSTSYQDGRPIIAESETLYVMGAVQPSTPAVLNRVPEGSKNHEVLTFYISTIIDTDGKRIPIELNDEFEYRGHKFLVFEASQWDHIGDYTEASGARKVT